MKYSPINELVAIAADTLVKFFHRSLGFKLKYSHITGLEIEITLNSG